MAFPTVRVRCVVVVVVLHVHVSVQSSSVYLYTTLCRLSFVYMQAELGSHVRATL